MTKHERAKLATIVSRIVAHQLMSGQRVTTSQIVAEVRNIAPDLVDEVKDRLIDAALSSMANQQLKRASKNEREEMEVTLFGNREPGLSIPKSIALPSPEGAREMIWVATTNATVAELDQYLGFLSKGIKADQRKYQQVRTFRDRVMEVADTDDPDVPIREMLEGLRARQARAV